MISTYYWWRFSLHLCFREGHPTRSIYGCKMVCSFLWRLCWKDGIQQYTNPSSVCRDDDDQPDKKPRLLLQSFWLFPQQQQRTLFVKLCCICQPHPKHTHKHIISVSPLWHNTSRLLIPLNHGYARNPLAVSPSTTRSADKHRKTALSNTVQFCVCVSWVFLLWTLHVCIQRQ